MLNEASDAARPAAPVLVPAAALIDANGRVLVQRRPPGKHHAGLWEFPGGKAEPGEDLRAALSRELLEELDVRVEPADAHPLTFAADEGERPLLLLLYEVRRWSGTPQPLAASELRWLAPRALRDLPMPPLDRPLAAALERWVEARAGIEPACKDLQSSA